MHLTGQQFELLTLALLEAFPSPNRLERMVRYRLGKNLWSIALGDDLEEIAFKLVRTAESDGWLPQLIQGARQSNPGSGALVRISHLLGMTSLYPPEPELEALIRSSNEFLDINIWRNQLGEIEGRVCRVEISLPDGDMYGTGFLVGPNAIMTNYHVIEPFLIANHALPTNPTDADSPQVVFRFDFKRTNQGSAPHTGIEFRLASSNWLIDHSPYKHSQMDDGNAALGYALLRTEDSPGHLPLGDDAEPGAQKRGWIKIPDHPYEFKPGTPLLIVQHPKGDPLQLALDTEAVIDIAQNRSLVKYRTNTLPGSSGAPCFSAHWDLVALHHSGDPDFKGPSFNAGTPIDVIATQLKGRGHAHYLEPG